MIINKNEFCLLSQEYRTQPDLKIISINKKVYCTQEKESFYDLNIFYTGVIFNLHELSKDYNIGSTETEHVIAVLYKKYGIGIAKILDGAYALAIVDHANITLLCDREGFENLYYFKQNQEFIISSSIKEIKKFISLEVNDRVLPKYFVLDQINDKHTFFKNIYKINTLEVININLQDNTWQEQIYDEIAYYPLNDQHLNDSEILKSFEQLLTNRMENVLGSFPGNQIYNTLSGGIDSSLTQCLLKRIGYNYSICANFFEYGNDDKYSQSVSEYLNSNHDIIQVNTDDFFHNIEEGIHVSEKPLIFQGESMFISLYNHIRGKSINKNLPTLCFNSSGADCILGHGRLLMALNCFMKAPSLCFFLNNILTKKVHSEVGKLFEKMLISLKSTHMTADFFFAIFNRMSRVEIVKRAFEISDVSFIPEFELREQSKYPVNLLEKIYRLQVFQGGVKRINNIDYQLAKKNNIVLVFPFRDRELMQFFLNIPTERKTKRFTEKYYGKKLLSRYLPKKLIYRKKITKGIPFQKLFREDANFRDLIEEIKEGPSPYFNFNLEQVFSKSELEPLALKLINFHIWNKTFIKNQFSVEN